MPKKMLIDATHLEETRVVVADGNRVDDFDFESINKRQLAGNIYLAKITRVEPSLQAAFVDYGGNRHGFLAFSEIHPDYYQIPVADREALLAEEAAEQARLAGAEQATPVRDESADSTEDREKPKSRSRRGKRRSRGKESGDATGLEVIDLDTDSTVSAEAADDTPAATDVRGLEIADLSDDEPAPATAEPAAVEPVAVKPEDGTETADGPPVDAVGADVENLDDLTADDAGKPDTTPKSIAESAGLDDDDSVSGDVLDDAPKVSESAEATETAEKPAPKPKPKPRRSRKKVQPAPEAEAAPQTEAVESSPSEATPEITAEAEVATSAEATGDPVAAAAPDSEPATDAASDGESPEDSGKAADKPAAREAKKPARGRQRRSRTEPEDEDDDTPAEAPEAVGSMGSDDTQEEAAKVRAKRRIHYKIQDVVKVRQIMLVQVVKEERGNKGAALTTYLSLAGRYCVLMPNTARGGGISRKITSAGDRKRLREITDELEVPSGIGLIVRTAGAERTRPEIKRDFEFLLRQWEKIRELTLRSTAPSLIYEEGSLIKRSIRDLYSKDIDAILVEGDEGYREAKDYMKMLMPSHAKNVQLYDEQIPLYTRYQVETYLNSMFNPTVQLRSGGYIVIGVTEALVAIDVNSGRSTKESSIEETALKTNLEAAEEVARQLRLRDLAGLIVIDFIDMDENRNNRAVEKRMKDRLKTDRARIQVGRISTFGLMEMSRQRLRPGMLEATTQPCPHCLGEGTIRSEASLALSILREVEEECARARAAEILVSVPISVANYVINAKRQHLVGIERRYGMTITILGDPLLTSPLYRIERSKVRSRPAEVPDVAITAESAISETVIASVEDAPELAADVPTDRGDDRGRERAADRGSDRGSDERSEGRSRRRRGKRGGQRRRRDENEAGTDENAPGVDADAAQTGTSGDAPTSENGESDERRSSRRRRGRGRSRRSESEAGSENRAAEDDVTASPSEAKTVDQSAAPAPESEMPESAPVEAEAAAVQPVAELVADADVELADQDAPAAAEPVAEVAAETAAVSPEPQPEPEAIAVVEPAMVEEARIEKPAEPKRRGWWSRG